MIRSKSGDSPNLKGNDIFSVSTSKTSPSVKQDF